MNARAAIPSLALVDGVVAGKPAAIARLITRAERGEPECEAALAEIHRRAGRAHIVGITGVPGSGKSTLIARLCRTIRDGGRSIAIVAVDPTSPFSGGSILGDRIRMSEVADDPGIFIRSMATRGALGGLSRATLPAVDVLDAAGFDVVLIETVGVGQDEVDVVRAAHTTVVVSAPGLGDDIQAIKAGILEIADIHAVSKCDRSDANRTVTELKQMLALGLQLSEKSAWRVPVIATSALSGEGLGELAAAIDDHLAAMKAGGEFRARLARMAETRLLKDAEELLRARFERHRGSDVEALVAQITSRALAPAEAARHLIDSMKGEPEP